jgi:hypothetical protein
MTPTDVKLALRSALIEERIMDGLRDQVPPPSDVEAERVVLGALICGEAEAALADGLQPSDFYLPLHRWVFERWLEGARSADDFQAAAEGGGMVGPQVPEQIDGLRWLPVILVPPMTAWVERILEAAARRTIWEICSKVSLRLRFGDMTAEEAKGELRKLTTT